MFSADSADIEHIQICIQKYICLIMQKFSFINAQTKFFALNSIFTHIYVSFMEIRTGTTNCIVAAKTVLYFLP